MPGLDKCFRRLMVERHLAMQIKISPPDRMASCVVLQHDIYSFGRIQPNSPVNDKSLVQLGSWLRHTKWIHVISKAFSALSNAGDTAKMKRLSLTPPYFVTPNYFLAKAQSSTHCRRRKLGGRAEQLMQPSWRKF